MTQRESLFRAAAANAVIENTAFDDSLRIMRPRLWVAGAVLALLVAGALAWSFFFTIPVAVSGQGILLAPGGVTDIFSEANGRLQAITAKPGDVVKVGDLIARVEQPEVRLKLTLAQGELQDAEKLRRQVIDLQGRDTGARGGFESARLVSLNGRIDALRKREAVLRERADVMGGLVTKGFVTRDHALSASQDLLTLTSQIADAEDERNKMQAEAEVRRSADQRALLEADQKVTNASRGVQALREQLTRMDAVLSPFAGKVIATKANVGQIVQPGTPILTLERQGATRAGVPMVVVYVTAADGKKIKVGMPAEVSPSTSRREEEGFMRGRVVRVADVPASSASMARVLQNDRLVETFMSGLRTPFEVEVELETEPGDPTTPVWSSQRARALKVDSGTLADIRFTVRSMPLIAVAIPALQDRGQAAQP